MATASVCAKPADAPADAPLLDLSLLDPILQQFKGQKGAVIPILQRAQEALGYLPKSALQYIARKTRIPLNQLYGVATFYSQFHLKRRGRNVVKVCDGTACHVRGADKALAAVAQSLGVAPGTTSSDYKMTLEVVYCLGSCGLAPVAVVNEKVHGRLVPDQLVQRLESLE